MLNLASKVFRKFIDVIDINNIQIKSDNVWNDIKTINKTIKYEKYIIKFVSNNKLICADNHILIDENNEQIFAKDSLNKRIKTINGVDTVISVIKTNKSVNMYDLSLSDNSNHLYYTNGILSHNTTTYTIFALWYTMFFPDKKIMLLANKAETMIEIIGRIALGYQYLPSFLKCSVETWNKTEIKFCNLSAIKGFASGSDAARGFSANCVIWDEAGFTADNIADKIFTSIYPVISSSKNSKFIMVSTPNGTSSKNVYYNTYLKAKSANKSMNSEGWKLFQFDWWDVPMRDEQWKKKTIESIGERRFRQEFGNEFLDSAQFKKLIPDDKIEQFRIKLSEYKSKNILQGKTLSISSQDGSREYVFKMYHEFDRNRTYLASGDCAEGIGGDNSVLYIWDITETNNIKLCLKFADNRTSLMEFAYLTTKILQMYANPFLAIESNGIGVGYIEQLRRVFGYENLVRLNRENGYGINSHATIKSKACLWFREMITTEGFGFEISDRELVEEMSTFVKKDNTKLETFCAVGDNHDDLIMSMVWMGWILNEENLEKYYIVTENFTSSLGKIYPKSIQPLMEYTIGEIRTAMNDPIYRDFMNWKLMLDEKAKDMLLQERMKSGYDPFEFSEMTQNMNNRELIELKRKMQEMQDEINAQKSAINPQQNRGGCLFSFGSDEYDDWDSGGIW